MLGWLIKSQRVSFMVTCNSMNGLNSNRIHKSLSKFWDKKFDIFSKQKINKYLVKIVVIIVCGFCSKLAIIDGKIICYTNSIRIKQTTKIGETFSTIVDAGQNFLQASASNCVWNRFVAQIS